MDGTTASSQYLETRPVQARSRKLPVMIWADDLAACDVPVLRLSEHHQDLRQELNFRTPMWLARSCQQIRPDGTVFLSSKHIWHPDYRSHHLWGQIKEFMRHKIFLARLWRCASCLAILPSDPDRRAEFLSLRGIRLKNMQPSPMRAIHIKRLMRKASQDPPLMRICEIALWPELRKSALVYWIKQGRRLEPCQTRGTGKDLRVMATEKTKNAWRYADHLLGTTPPSADELEKTRLRQCNRFLPMPDAQACSDKQALIDWFNDPFGPHKIPDSFAGLFCHQPHGVSGLGVLLCLLSRAAMPDLCPKQIWTSATLCAWQSTIGIEQLALDHKPRPASIPCIPKLQILDGSAKGTGLAQNTTMMKRSLDRLIAPTLNNRTSWRTKQSAVLHMCNAERLPQSILTPQFIDRRDQLHIGFGLWEMQGLPKSHHLGLELVDELWAPTQFVSDQYAKLAPQKSFCVGKALHQLDELAEIGRIKHPKGNQLVVAMIFDAHSTYARKNPIAALHAFQTAFPKRLYDDVRLIIKTTKTARDHWGDPEGQRAQIKAAISKDARISLRTEWLDQNALYGLIARTDVIVSPHRGEGFGYIPAFALAIGRPVIATDWSGTRDFINEKTGYPCAYQLSSAHHLLPSLAPPDALWAEVEIDSMAQQLRRVYHDPRNAVIIAKEGQSTIQALCDPARFETRIHERLRAVGVI